MADQIVTSRHDQRIASADGRMLHTTMWLPAERPAATVVVVHGFNSHSGYYPWVAERLVAAGLAVCTFDLRGRGKSEGERYFIESFREYQDDVHAVVSLARSRAPELPIFLLGHSAGGVISSVYALDHQQDIAGLICESFAFKVFAPDIALTVLKGLSHVVPHTHVLRLNIDDFSRDPAVIAAMKADPQVGDEVQPTLTVAEMVRADERLEREFPNFRLPVLILHGDADKVTRPEGSRQFHAAAGSADKTLKLYPGHAHDLLNDFGKEDVMADITAWLTARIPARSA